MQVILGRILAVFGTTELEEIIAKRGINDIVTDLLFYYFLFIYFGMFGVE
jgi:hypothetical protein